MVEGRDSAYPPNDAQLDAFYAQGVRVYGGYIKLGNDGLLNGWSQADFDRVRAHGMTPIAYMSGWDDPGAAAATARSWAIAYYCLDDEGGIRPDGAWVPWWLSVSDSGLYGNWQYHAGRVARFHVMAAYPTSGDPGGQSWPSWAARPPTPCGWQWAGSHNENGITVDSAWFDDSFSPVYGGGAGQLSGGDRMELLRRPSDGTIYEVGPDGKRAIGPEEFGDLGKEGSAQFQDASDVLLASIPNAETPADLKAAVDELKAAIAAISVPAAPDLSAIVQAVNDAKAAAVAAQTAAQNAAAAAQTAATAAQNANSNAAAAAAGVGQIVTKLDNAGKAL